MHRKLILASVAAGLVIMFAATPALAQDCFVVNRSTTGSIQAGAHSPKWDSFTVTGDFLGLPPGQCADDINAALTAADLPTVFASRTDKVLLANLPASRSALLANAKGIDHFEVSPIVPAIENVVTAVVSTDPACP